MTGSTEAAIVVLAGGTGGRMRSDIPKVLHKLAGRSMLAHALGAAAKVAPQHLIVVLGHERERIAVAIAEKNTQQTPHKNIGEKPVVPLSATAPRIYPPQYTFAVSPFISTKSTQRPGKIYCQGDRRVCQETTSGSVLRSLSWFIVVPYVIE